MWSWRAAVGVTEEQISALERRDVVATCFFPAQQAAFDFTDEVVFIVETLMLPTSERNSTFPIARSPRFCSYSAPTCLLRVSLGLAAFPWMTRRHRPHRKAHYKYERPYKEPYGATAAEAMLDHRELSIHIDSSNRRPMPFSQ